MVPTFADGYITDDVAILQRQSPEGLLFCEDGRSSLCAAQLLVLHEHGYRTLCKPTHSSGPASLRRQEHRTAAESPPAVVFNGARSDSTYPGHCTICYAPCPLLMTMLASTYPGHCTICYAPCPLLTTMLASTYTGHCTICTICNAPCPLLMTMLASTYPGHCTICYAPFPLLTTMLAKSGTQLCC